MILSPTVNRRWLFLTAGMLALLGLAAIVWLALRPHLRAQLAAAETPASASVSGNFQPTAAQWASLTFEPVQVTAFDGLTTAEGLIVVNDNATANVYSQFSGRVTSISGQPGQNVRRGAVLLTMLATEAAQAKGDLAAAAAAEDTARKQVEMARLTEQRQHDLFLAEAGAEKDWLQSKADLAVAENAERAAQAGMAAAREKATVLSGSQTPGGRDAVITAPIDGVIVQRQVAPGQFVNSLATGGSAPLYTISDLRTVWIVAMVSETDATRARVGQPVDITALALPGRVLHSKISWVAASVDATTHRLPVRAEVPNGDGALKPQMSVTVQLLEPQPVRSLAVPRSAVVYDGPQAHCYVALPDRTLAVRKLILGRVQGDLIEVKAGLTPQDRVLVKGPLFIDRATDGST